MDRSLLLGEKVAEFRPDRRRELAPGRAGEHRAPELGEPLLPVLGGRVFVVPPLDLEVVVGKVVRADVEVEPTGQLGEGVEVPLVDERTAEVEEDRPDPRVTRRHAPSTPDGALALTAPGGRAPRELRRH